MKKEMRMQDVPWKVSEEMISKMFPHLPENERAEVAGNYSQYLKVVAKIHDDLEANGKLKDVLLRIQYEKRNRNKPESHN